MKKILNYLMAGLLMFASYSCSNTNEVKKPDNGDDKVEFGEGSKESPYSVTAAIQNQEGMHWVVGYIVGYVDTSGEKSVWVFDATNCEQETNLLLAEKADETNQDKTLVVQLPTGAIRSALNLKANASLLGKKVTLYGSLEAYFKKAGIKGVSYCVFEDGKTAGTEPVDASNAIYFESFAKNISAFTAYSVAGEETWEYNGKYKCAYISGYAGKNDAGERLYHANEDWLISPEINLAGKANAVFSFEQALRYNENPAVAATAWVSENYKEGNPTDATWVQLETNLQDGPDWSFVNAGEFSLAKFKDKKIRIALKYTSTDINAGTWEVRNFIVK